MPPPPHHGRLLARKALSAPLPFPPTRPLRAWLQGGVGITLIHDGVDAPREHRS